MKTLEMLFDMTALGAKAELAGAMDLSIHGDAAIAALQGWAASRGVEVAASVQRHSVNGRGYTVAVAVAGLGDRKSITAFGDWHPAEADDATISAPGTEVLL